jgi:hypothetical protein
LCHHLKKAASCFGVEEVLWRCSILGDDEEQVLVDLIMDMESRLYGCIDPMYVFEKLCKCVWLL